MKASALARFAGVISLACMLGCGKETASFAKVPHIPGPIDSLAEDASVEAFVRKQDTTLGNFVLRDVSDYQAWISRSDSLVQVQVKKIRPPRFFRGDFDNNGYTDLVVTGDRRGWCADTTALCSFDCLLLLQHPDSVSIRPLSGWRSEVIAAYPVKRDGRSLISIYDTGERLDMGSKPKLEQIDLTLRDGRLVEYNAAPALHHIEKIKFSKSACYGSCPVFDLAIDEKGNAVFKAEAYNFSDEGPKPNRRLKPGESLDTMDFETYKSIFNEGKYKTVIRKKDLERAMALLNYIDFTKLQDRYSITATDLPGAELEITYDGGKVKRISDYGLNGTFGLQAVYEELSALRFSQEWRPTPPRNTRKKS